MARKAACRRMVWLTSLFAAGVVGCIFLESEQALAQPQAFTFESAVETLAVSNPSKDGKTYRITPDRITYGAAPFSFATVVSEAAKDSSVTLNLTGATYSSSDPKVIAIDAKTGQATVLKRGITELKATLTNNQGTVSELISVLPIDLTNNSNATIAAIPQQTYTGKAVTPALTVSLGKTTLVAGQDYTASYLNNNKVGTATAIVNGLGNYTGNLSTTFTIVKATTSSPKPEPSPSPGEDDKPKPDETPKPKPDEDPDQNPDVDPNPTPTPDVDPNPTPDVDPDPAPDEDPNPSPSPDENPNPNPSSPTPTPERPEVAHVYRLYNPYNGWHLYTESANEYATLANIGWQQEGVAWYAPQSGPDIYRLYNPYTGWHFYTMSEYERQALAALGWQPEGVSFHSASDTGIPIYRLYNPGNGLHLFTQSANERNTLEALPVGAWNYEGIAWYGERVGTASVG